MRYVLYLLLFLKQINFEIIQKRRIEKRRKEIAQNASQTLAALEAGTAKRGNVLQLLADLKEE